MKCNTVSSSQCVDAAENWNTNMDMNFGEVFAVVDGGSSFLCEPCAKKEKVELDSEHVPTWEVGSSGWLAPIACKKCLRSIPVVCDGEPAKSNNKYIICCDFDGVLHSYASGWKGATVIPDGPVEGAMEWLMLMTDDPSFAEFEVAVYSSRSKERGGIEAMRSWLSHHFEGALRQRLLEVTESDIMSDVRTFLSRITFPTQKPAASMTIDDRAFCFEGTFPTPEWLKAFKPWNKRK